MGKAKLPRARIPVEYRPGVPEASGPHPGDTVYEPYEAAQADLFEDDFAQHAPDQAW